jgi:hypothetical protein
LQTASTSPTRASFNSAAGSPSNGTPVASPDVISDVTINPDGSITSTDFWRAGNQDIETTRTGAAQSDAGYTSLDGPAAGEIRESSTTIKTYDPSDWTQPPTVATSSYEANQQAQASDPSTPEAGQPTQSDSSNPGLDMPGAGASSPEPLLQDREPATGQSSYRDNAPTNSPSGTQLADATPQNGSENFDRPSEQLATQSVPDNGSRSTDDDNVWQRLKELPGLMRDSIRNELQPFWQRLRETPEMIKGIKNWLYNLFDDKTDEIQKGVDQI